jgi:hypothetical protein
MAPGNSHVNLDSDDDDNDVQEVYTPPPHTDFPNCTADALREAISIWLEVFKPALSKPDNYTAHHDHLLDGFQLLSHLAHGLGEMGGSILAHVGPVMKDMYFRGWDRDLHQDPLVKAYKAWKNGRDVRDFEPGAGAGPRGRKRPERKQPARAGEWLAPLVAAESAAERPIKGKGKQKEAAPVKKATGKASTPSGATKRASSSKPPATSAAGKKDKTSFDSSADEEELALNNPPCIRCAEQDVACTAKEPAPPKKQGGKPVIFHSCGPCGLAKAKCSLVPAPAGSRKGAKSDAKAAEEGSDEGASVRAPRPRKKTPAMTVVPAGGPGELGKFRVPLHGIRN